MAVEIVRFYFTDQDALPIFGVLVRVYDAAGAVFITQDYTIDVGGEAVAEVTLVGDNPPISYTIRASKTGTAFDGGLGSASKSPQLVAIYSPAVAAPTGTNDFDIQGQTFSRPTAADPRLCLCSGFFKDASGRPLPNLDMSFINQFRPAIVDGDAILGSGIELRTDAAGYAQLNLYRNAEYLAMIQSIEAAEADDTGAIIFPRSIVVPDQASFNLVRLLFPIVAEVVFTPGSVTLSVDDSAEITTVIKASDDRILIGTACEDVLYSTADEAIATVAADIDKLIVRGARAGTTELLATRKNQTIVSIPDLGITGSPLIITVI